jgi:hypothetical protein
MALREQTTATPLDGPFLPLSGGTVAGPLTVSNNTVFASGVGGTIGLAVVNSVSGAMDPVGGVAPFEIIVSPNSVDSSGNPGGGFFAQTIQHNFGGTKGGQGCINMLMQQQDDVLDTGTVFINPLFTQLYCNHGGGGAGGAIAAATTCEVGGSGWGLAEGTETGLVLGAGAGVAQAYVETYIWTGAVHATVSDAMNAFSATAGSAVGVRSIFQIGRDNDQWPLDPGGWVLATVEQITNNPGNTQRWAQMCAGGIDFSKVLFSQAAFRSSGVSIEAGTVRIGTLSIYPTSNGMMFNASVGTIGTITLPANAGSGYRQYDLLHDGHGGIISVTGVDGNGGVTGAAYVDDGRSPYSPFGPGPATVTTTGGSGSGATFNVSWATRRQIQIPTDMLVGELLTASGGLRVTNGALVLNNVLYFERMPVNAANDAAAGAAGVGVGSVYLNGSALQVRVA